MNEDQDKIVKEFLEKKKKFEALEKKENWGDGDWQTEPDEYEFEYNGYKGYLIRHMGLGHWCGYLAIPIDSKWAQGDNCESLDVHGGVTYSGTKLPNQMEESKDTFYIGFDCAHYLDYVPKMKKILEYNPFYEHTKNPYEIDDIYRTMDFVIDEIKKMIDQVKEENGNSKA